MIINKENFMIIKMVIINEENIEFLWKTSKSTKLLLL